jgi:hypothetical protein
MAWASQGRRRRLACEGLQGLGECVLDRLARAGGDLRYVLAAGQQFLGLFGDPSFGFCPSERKAGILFSRTMAR